MKRKIALLIALIPGLMPGCIPSTQALEIATSAKRVQVQAKSRQIVFPAEGLGKYYTSPPEGCFMVQWPMDPAFKSAKGKVQVPVNATVTLATCYAKDESLPLLKSLKPGDIQRLDVLGSYIDPHTIRHILLVKNLEGLVIAGTFIDDATFSRVVQSMPQLNELDIGHIDLTNRSIDSILKLTRLRSLSINKTKINDAGIAKLAGLKSLTYLDLRETPITDSSLASISKMQGLRTLNLANTKVTDKGLRYLISMPNLKRLDLSQTAITDATARNILSKMISLEELNLSRTAITNEGVKALNPLSNLRKLWIRDNLKVTSASVSHLASHKKMQDLELQKSGIDPAGIQRLGNALPNSEVHSKSPCQCRKRERVN